MEYWQTWKKVVGLAVRLGTGPRGRRKMRRGVKKK
jgi:hypothetical protein